jgi:hypothetical protein
MTEQEIQASDRTAQEFYAEVKRRVQEYFESGQGAIFPNTVWGDVMTEVAIEWQMDTDEGQQAVRA